MQKLLLTLILALSLPLFASAQTLSDLESKIAAILSQIQTLQTELQTLKSTEVTPAIPQTSSSTFFTTTLGKGSEGSEVTALQQYLAKDPTL
ncbi:MAG: hypothetical protein NUV42_01460, partial [Candidatus Yonathbacteria bacterium]|nr:hypothetical protein [Candidatus Yonathbacteria bacterium]